MSQETLLEMFKSAITIVVAIIANGGFWAYVNGRKEKREKSQKLMLGMARTMIIEASMKYIDRGWISQEEHDSLCELYEPYQDMGGNGTAARLLTEVAKLPIRQHMFDVKRNLENDRY